nr:helix-turn-helix transcriptional regulator [Lactobacillus mulieris]MDK8082160.1 helix-turn-helix transcriptional regulator [Lactobacillus mulieris]
MAYLLCLNIIIFDRTLQQIITKEVNNMSQELVESIKAIGKLQNKTLREIGLESGVGENAIYRWNKNEPRLSTLKKVADYLGVDYKIFLP